jgi:branched-subunit amino acid aminotransferase/4-amino-4-deoxychorismate lyase
MSFIDQIATGYHRRLAELQASPNPLAHGVAYVDGAYVPVNEARIPLLDQGFMKGDLTYDVPAIWDGRFFRLDDHLDRFQASIAKMRYNCPLTRQEIRDKLVEMAAMSGIRDAFVMMIVTRGLRYLRAYAPEDCPGNCYLMVIPYLWVMDLETQAKGASAVVTRTVRRTPPGAFDPTVKNLQWGDFTRGIMEARDRGCVYPILTDGDTNITEGSGFNVVLIKDNQLFTPKRGVLEGVTRSTVLEVARGLGYKTHLDEVPVELAYQSDEIMFVTTAGGVMPVTMLDGEPIGSGEVGPVTKAIWKGYWDAHTDPKWSFGVNYY